MVKELLGHIHISRSDQFTHPAAGHSSSFVIDRIDRNDHDPVLFAPGLQCLYIALPVFSEVIVASDHDHAGVHPSLQADFHKGLRTHPLYPLIKRKREEVIDAHMGDQPASCRIGRDQVLLGFARRRILKCLYRRADLILLCLLEHGREDLLVSHMDTIKIAQCHGTRCRALHRTGWRGDQLSVFIDDAVPYVHITRKPFLRGSGVHLPSFPDRSRHTGPLHEALAHDPPASLLLHPFYP